MCYKTFNMLFERTQNKQNLVKKLPAQKKLLFSLMSVDVDRSHEQQPMELLKIYEQIKNVGK